MKYELHPGQAELSKALYVIRLGWTSFRSAGRWINRTVTSRRNQNRWAWDRVMNRHPSYPQPWQPPEGRRSPREDWMDDRRFRQHYWQGQMRWLHGHGMPLVGSPRIYVLRPMPPEMRDCILRDKRRRYTGNQWAADLADRVAEREAAERDAA